MKTLFRFLGSRWFLTLLGTLALALLIWFIGPLISVAGVEPLASPRSRYMAVGALFGLWGFVRIGSVVRARLRNRRLMEQLAARPAAAPDPAKAASEEELQVLRERFDAAGLSVEIQPWFGNTPFNNWMVLARRPAA